MLNSYLAPDIVDKITCVPISLSGSTDKIIWSGTSSGHFSVKSAYTILCDVSGQNEFWGKIWSLNIPPKLKIFLWTFVSGKLLTNDQRFRRRISNDASCFFCHGIQETMLHLFRDCPNAKKLWRCFNIPLNMQASFNLGWKE